MSDTRNDALRHTATFLADDASHAILVIDTERRHLSFEIGFEQLDELQAKLDALRTAWVTRRKGVGGDVNGR